MLGHGLGLVAGQGQVCVAMAHAEIQPAWCSSAMVKNDAFRCTVHCICTRCGPSDEDGNSRGTQFIHEVFVILSGLSLIHISEPTRPY